MRRTKTFRLQTIVSPVVYMQVPFVLECTSEQTLPVILMTRCGAHEARTVWKFSPNTLWECHRGSDSRVLNSPEQVWAPALTFKWRLRISHDVHNASCFDKFSAAFLHLFLPFASEPSSTGGAAAPPPTLETSRIFLLQCNATVWYSLSESASTVDSPAYP